MLQWNRILFVRDHSAFTIDELTNVFSGRVDFTSGNFYANAEFVTKSDDAIYVFEDLRGYEKGNAFYLNFGYTQKDWD